MATRSEWVSAARPRTLPAAAASVLLGTGGAAYVGQANALFALLAVGVALTIQIGVNYANDYSDGIRGTDQFRVGPARLTASGRAAPREVKRAALLCFGLSAVFGLVLVALSNSWPLVAVGVLSLLAAWFYTGGKNPYGYLGLSEPILFVTFGWFATLGTTWTQAHSLPWPVWLGASGSGLLSCALLMVNNLRDIPTDAAAGKHTLAVRLGDRRSRRLYAGYLGVALLLGLACIPATGWAALVLLLVPPATILALGVFAGARGRLLLPALTGTGLLILGYCVLLGIALAAAN